MNREGYIKIMFAVARLIVVIMVEAGGTPVQSAKRIANALLQATVGKKLDPNE
jgi:hypothetical protein